MAYETDSDTEDAPSGASRNAGPWLDMIADAEKCYQAWQEKSDNIDKLYANLEAMSGVSTDREFQIFWANLEVLKPSIYARPPVPVVVPRFKDRKELPRRASEMLERALATSFENEDVDQVMRQVRDDLATVARGEPWLRYEAEEGADGRVTEKVCYDHVDRRDFLHDPARKWKEVEWVARRSWLTRKKGLKRFGDAFLKAEFRKRDDGTDEGEYKTRERAPVWELWHKGEKVVVWVSPGMDEVLDIQAPFLDLAGFFPCPRPAYATVQRTTLVPVPDFLFYKDQVEEINEMTARISALAEALRLKGFYAGGAEDLSDAIEAALKSTDNNAFLIPVSNFAALGGQGLKDSIVWLPVREVAEVITGLIALRKELISDVYELTGLSDIMRGSTDANETLGAQQLKSQYGSVRIRDKQGELVRVARDVARIAGEIMAENFSPQTLLEMSQVDDLPTEQAIAAQVAQIEGQAQAAAAQPQVQEMARQNPEQAQQILGRIKAQVDALKATVTVEKVVSLLREQRLRPFVLDIETDSTIQPDEDAAKQRATEFVTAVGGFLGQALPMIQQVPQSAPMAAEMLKFTASQFRAGRELDGVIDEFAEQIKEAAGQDRPDPEAVKAEAEAKAVEAKAQADAQIRQMDAQAKQIGLEISRAEGAIKLQQIDAKARADAAKAQTDMALGQQQIRLSELAIELAQVNLANAKAKPEPKEAA